MKLAIVIPYYQRSEGILRRALASVVAQEVSPQLTIDLIIVDDGSPHPASHEIEGLAFPEYINLRLVVQPNSGVAVARNTGLDAVSEDTTYISFLDSDDIWNPRHLQNAIACLEKGYDFYFCDNARDEHHSSYFATSCAPILDVELSSEPRHGTLDKLTIETFVLKDFVCQASTVVFRRSIAPDLRFDTRQKKAGEDLIYFLKLTASTHRICFSPEQYVRCGLGMNMYFSNLNWDSDGHIPVVIDQLRAHIKIRKEIPLDPANARWLSQRISTLRKQLLHRSLRQTVKRKGKVPKELIQYFRDDLSGFKWLGA